MGESFNRIWYQVAEFFSRLTNVQKLLMAGIAVVFIAATILTLVFTSSPPYEPLFNDLSAKDAGEIVERLREQNIDYKLVNGGRTIMVPAGRLYDLRVAFARDGLPESGTVGYELFDQQELGVTEFQQLVTYKRALEGELEKTISSIDGIEKASVMIVIPKERLFEKDQKVPTASVQLKLRRKALPSETTVEAISHLVANSVEGLLPENITITDTKGRILSKNRNPNDALAMSSDQLAYTRQVESDLEQKVLAVLEKRVGVGNVSVQVNANLNWSTVERTIKDVDPERTVTISEEINEQTQPGSATSGTTGGSSTSTVTNYETSRTVQRIVEGVGNIEQLSVAVLVNNRAERKTDEEGNVTVDYVPRSEEEMRQLEQLAKTAVGFNPNRNDQFSIVNMQFDPAFEEEPESAPWYGDPMGILEKVLIVLSLGLGVFLVRSLLLSVKAKGDEIQAQIQQLTEQERQALAGKTAAGDHAAAIAAGATGAQSLPGTTTQLIEHEGALQQTVIQQVPGSTTQVVNKTSMKDSGDLMSGEVSMEGDDAELISTEDLMSGSYQKNEVVKTVVNFAKKNPGSTAKLMKLWLLEDE
jgi:flagellar M-ring protein FliF